MRLRIIIDRKICLEDFLLRCSENEIYERRFNIDPKLLCKFRRYSHEKRILQSTRFEPPIFSSLWEKQVSRLKRNKKLLSQIWNSKRKQIEKKLNSMRFNLPKQVVTYLVFPDLIKNKPIGHGFYGKEDAIVFGPVDSKKDFHVFLHELVHLLIPLNYENFTIINEGMAEFVSLELEGKSSYKAVKEEILGHLEHKVNERKLKRVYSQLRKMKEIGMEKTIINLINDILREARENKK